MRIALSLLVVAACAGKAPPAGGSNPDATTDGDVETSFMLSGKAVDYFGGGLVDGAEITTDGLVPALMTTSQADGSYALDVAVGSSLFLVATKGLYRPTRNAPVTIGDTPLTQDVLVTSQQDVKNQYTAVGATPVAGTAFLVAELRTNNNAPLEGIPVGNVQLLDAQNAPVTGIKGPYFFNAAGSISTAELTAKAYSGRSRVAILDVPPGTYTLAVNYPNGAGNVTINTTVSTITDGTTLALSGGMMGGGSGGVTDPTFAANIYPKLQRAALGGLGCANCHTLSGPAAFLKLDDPAATVLASLQARIGVINTTTPADSFLLKRPLYEAPPTPQDHPNATFLDINDADYKLFLLWIQNGAKP